MCCCKEARVRDVIGLACLKYCAEDRPHRLEPPVSNYQLFMCEDDGTLDSDFPALENNVSGTHTIPKKNSAYLFRSHSLSMGSVN